MSPKLKYTDILKFGAKYIFGELEEQKEQEFEDLLLKNKSYDEITNGLLLIAEEHNLNNSTSLLAFLEKSKQSGLEVLRTSVQKTNTSIIDDTSLLKKRKVIFFIGIILVLVIFFLIKVFYQKSEPQIETFIPFSIDSVDLTSKDITKKIDSVKYINPPKQQQKPLLQSTLSSKEEKIINSILDKEFDITCNHIRNTSIDSMKQYLCNQLEKIELLFNKKEYTSTITLLHKSLAIAKKDSLSYFTNKINQHLAYIYLYKNRKNKAHELLTSLHKPEEISDDQLEIQTLLAWIHVKENNYDEAKQILKKLNQNYFLKDTKQGKKTLQMLNIISKF